MRARRRTPQATGPHQGTAHAPAPAVLSGSPTPHDSGGRVPTSGVRRGKHLGQREPEGPDPAAPPPAAADLHATARAGPHLRSGAEGEANAPEGDPGGGRTAESESRRSGQGNPSPCSPRRAGPGRVPVGPSPRPEGHGEMLVDPARPPQSRDLERRDGHPPQKPTEPISGDSRTSLGLGVPGTVTASVAGL